MYYLWFNETQSGPFTLGQLKSMWAAGQITTETLYWQEGNAEWQPLSSIVTEIEEQTRPALLAHTVVMPPFEQVMARKTEHQASQPSAQESHPALAEPEQDQWTGHPTLWKWAWLLALAFIFIALSGGLFVFYNQGLLLNLSPVVPALLIFLYIYFARNSTRYTVSNKRVGLETGIFNKSSRELRIEDIRSIAAQTNVLGYGRIEFSSAASDDAEVVFSAVPRAAAVRDLVKKLQK